MQIVNRNKSDDAQRVINEFITEGSLRRTILSFLLNAISFTNDINPKNWNINLDKNGKFIRFNVGQEYCIEIFPKYISVLLLKKYIPRILVENLSDLEFKGYNGKKKVISSRVELTPDCLVKIPGSIACHVRYEEDYALILSYLEQGNRKFIEEANNHTRILPAMMRAHSPGFIAYLSKYFDRQIQNPAYVEMEEFILSQSFPAQRTKNGGFFGNSEINREVEQAAISFVWDHYKRRGWQVKSVETEKCGFDLLCTKGKKQECVEVKGIQGSIVSFIITAGEVKQARINDNFVLSVVTSALSNPKLHNFSAKDFNNQFELETISYRAFLKTNL